MSWLQSRLAPVKNETARWEEFAAAIEQFWAENFDPVIDFTTSLRSIFEADPDGQDLIIHNMGPYFEDNLQADHVAVAVMLRQYMLQLKYSMVPIDRELKRLGVVSEWSQLWATEDVPYGAKFYTPREVWPVSYLDGTWTLNDAPPKVVSPYEYYLTSRGVFLVDLEGRQDYGDLAAARQRASRLLPLHIVSDGFRYLGAGQATLPCPEQPRLDGRWDVVEDNGIVIKVFITSHDDILSKLDTAEMVFAPSRFSLDSAEGSPVQYSDYGDRIVFMGALQKQEKVGQNIAAAGLRIGDMIYGGITFPIKLKASDDSYSMTVTLYFP